MITFYLGSITRNDQTSSAPKEYQKTLIVLLIIISVYWPAPSHIIWFECHCNSTKVLIEDTVFMPPNRENGVAFFTEKEEPSFLSYLIFLFSGPVPEIEPATASSVVKRSIDWASTVAVINNYSSSPNGLWVSSPWGWRPNGLLTQRPWGRGK